MAPNLIWAGNTDPEIPLVTMTESVDLIPGATHKSETPAELLRQQMLPTEMIDLFIAKFQNVFGSGRQFSVNEWLELIPWTDSVPIQMAIKTVALKQVSTADEFVHILIDKSSKQADEESYKAANNKIIKNGISDLGRLTDVSLKHFQVLFANFPSRDPQLQIEIARSAFWALKNPRDKIRALNFTHNYPEYVIEHENLVRELLPILTKVPGICTADLQEINQSMRYLSPERRPLFRALLKRESVLLAKNIDELKMALSSDNEPLTKTIRKENDAIILELIPKIEAIPDLKSSEVLELTNFANNVPTFIALKKLAAKKAIHSEELSQALVFVVKNPTLVPLKPYEEGINKLILELIHEWDRFPGTPWKTFAPVLARATSDDAKMAIKKKAIENSSSGKDLIGALIDFGVSQGTKIDHSYMVAVKELVGESVKFLPEFPELRWTDLVHLMPLAPNDEVRKAIKRQALFAAKDFLEIRQVLSENDSQQPIADPYDHNVALIGELLTNSSRVYKLTSADNYSLFLISGANDSILELILSKMSTLKGVESGDYLALVGSAKSISSIMKLKRLAAKSAINTQELESALYIRPSDASLFEDPLFQERLADFFAENAIQRAKMPDTTIDDILLLQYGIINWRHVVKIKRAALPLVTTKRDLNQITSHTIENNDEAYQKAETKFSGMIKVLFEGAFEHEGDEAKLIRSIVSWDDFKEMDEVKRPGRILETIRSPKDLVIRFHQLLNLFSRPESDGHERAVQRILHEVPKLFAQVPDISAWLNMEYLLGTRKEKRIELRTKLAEATKQATDLKRLFLSKISYWEELSEETRRSGVFPSPIETASMAEILINVAIRKFPKEAAQIYEHAISEGLMQVHFPIFEADILKPEKRFVAKLRVKTKFLRSEDQLFPVRIIEHSNHSVAVISESDFTAGLYIRPNVPIYRVPFDSLSEIQFPELDPAFKKNLTLKQAGLKPISMELIPSQIRGVSDSNPSYTAIKLLFYLREQFKGVSPWEAIVGSERCFQAFTKTNSDP